MDFVAVCPSFAFRSLTRATGADVAAKSSVHSERPRRIHSSCQTVARRLCSPEHERTLDNLKVLRRGLEVVPGSGAGQYNSKWAQVSRSGRTKTRRRATGRRGALIMHEHLRRLAHWFGFRRFSRARLSHPHFKREAFEHRGDGSHDGDGRGSQTDLRVQEHTRRATQAQ